MPKILGRKKHDQYTYKFRTQQTMVQCILILGTNNHCQMEQILRSENNGSISPNLNIIYNHGSVCPDLISVQINMVRYFILNLPVVDVGDIAVREES